MALEIQTDPAEALAERAYQKAIDMLRDTVSAPETGGRNDPRQQMPMRTP
jgi:hypothetical protein